MLQLCGALPGHDASGPLALTQCRHLGPLGFDFVGDQGYLSVKGLIFGYIGLIAHVGVPHASVGCCVAQPY